MAIIKVERNAHKTSCLSGQKNLWTLQLSIYFMQVCRKDTKDLSTTAAKKYEKRYRDLPETDEVWIEKSIEVPSQETTGKQKRFRFGVAAGISGKVKHRFVVNYLNIHE